MCAAARGCSGEKGEAECARGVPAQWRPNACALTLKPAPGTFSTAPKNYTGFVALLPVMALVALSALAAAYMCCITAPPRLGRKCGAVPVAPVAARASRQPAHPVHVLRCARRAVGCPLAHSTSSAGAMRPVHQNLCRVAAILDCRVSGAWRSTVLLKPACRASSRPGAGSQPLTRLALLLSAAGSLGLLDKATCVWLTGRPAAAGLRM